MSNRYAIVATLTQALKTAVDSLSVIYVGSELANCVNDRQGD